MEQEIELIVAGHGVLTRVVGLFIALETLVQMGLAFGVVEGGRGLGLCGNGGIGSALQLLASVKEVLKLMEPITHPSRVLPCRCWGSGAPRGLQNGLSRSGPSDPRPVGF